MYPIIIIPNKVKEIVNNGSEKAHYRALVKIIGSKPVNPCPYESEPKSLLSRLGLFSIIIIIWICLIKIFLWNHYAILPIIGLTPFSFRFIMINFELPNEIRFYFEKRRKYKKYIEDQNKGTIEGNEYRIELAKYEEKRKEVIKTTIFKENYNEQSIKYLKEELSKSHNFELSDRFYNKTPYLGVSEDFFGNILKEKFNTYSNIKIDGYFPDFVIRVNEINLSILIEIDEYYEIKQKQPIHYIDTKGIHIDNNRDLHFLKNNYCLIRFTERQIILFSNDCIRILTDLVDSVKNLKEFQLNYDIEFGENKWTFEDSQQFALENKREKLFKKLPFKIRNIDDDNIF